MENTTENKSDNVKISDDERNIGAISIVFSTNRKISFLPIEIHEKMPNLWMIFAPSCSISTIGKKNFNKLTAVSGYPRQQNPKDRERYI